MLWRRLNKKWFNSWLSQLKISKFPQTGSLINLRLLVLASGIGESLGGHIAEKNCYCQAKSDKMFHVSFFWVRHPSPIRAALLETHWISAWWTAKAFRSKCVHNIYKPLYILPTSMGDLDDIRTNLQKAQRAAALIYAHFKMEFRFPVNQRNDS